MAYSTTNPPSLIAQPVGGRGPRLWSYTSTDAAATVFGSGYISNGAALGMKTGDSILVLNSASTLGSIGYVSVVVTSSAATLLSSFTTT